MTTARLCRIALAVAAVVAVSLLLAEASRASSNADGGLFALWLFGIVPLGYAAWCTGKAKPVRR